MIDTARSPANLFDLSGRVAIAAGASSGLGHRFTEVLHAAGASVIAVARRIGRIEALAARSERIAAVTADLARSGEVETLVPATLERFGRVDILIQ